MGTVRSVIPGMKVWSADGRRLGRVMRVSEVDHAFEVEHGFLFPRDSVVEASDIARVDADSVRLKSDRAAIRARWHKAEMQGDKAALKGLPRDGSIHQPVRMPLSSVVQANDRSASK